MGRDWHPDTSLMALVFWPLSLCLTCSSEPSRAPTPTEVPAGRRTPMGCYPTSRETSCLCPTHGTEGGSQAALLCWVLPRVSLVGHQLLEDKWLCLHDSSTMTCLQHGCADQPAAPAASPQQELVLMPALASLRSAYCHSSYRNGTAETEV